MGGNSYPSMGSILKELYEGETDGETEGERHEREFYNKCARIKGLPEISIPDYGRHNLSNLVYAQNPFLKAIKK